MFKWPDPPEGQILVQVPFAIYWGASFAVAVAVGVVMWELAASKDDKSRGFWKTLLLFGKNNAKEHLKSFMLIWHRTVEGVRARGWRRPQHCDGENVVDMPVRGNVETAC